MTKQESAKRIYNWAFNTLGNKKSGCIAMLCAKELSAIYEAGSDYEATYDAIERQLAEWRRERRPGVEAVLRVIEPMLTTDETASIRPA